MGKFFTTESAEITEILDRNSSLCPLCSLWWSKIQLCEKQIINILPILRPSAVFGVELGGEKRFGFVPDSFAGAVVEVGEPRFPVACKPLGVDCEVVVLRCLVSPVRAAKPDRLVARMVPERKPKRFRPRRLAKQKVPHADPENRLANGDRFLDVFDRFP